MLLLSESRFLGGNSICRDAGLFGGYLSIMSLTASTDFIGSEKLIEESQNLPYKAHEAGCVTNASTFLTRVVFRHRNAAIVAETVRVCVVMSRRRNNFVTAQVLLTVWTINTGGKSAFRACGRHLLCFILVRVTRCGNNLGLFVAANLAD